MLSLQPISGRGMTEMIRLRTPSAMLIVLLLSGCGVFSDDNSADNAKPSPGSSAGGEGPLVPVDKSPSISTAPTAVPSGPVPKSCALLSDAEVGTLTGQSVTNRAEINPPDDPTQSKCLWELTPGGALYLTLWRRTPAEFQLRGQGTTPIPGVGDGAYSDNLHLFVLFGTIELDIIVRSGEPDVQQRDRSIAVARLVGPRL
jgi:hypothetical protein